MLSYFTPTVLRKLRLQYVPCLGSHTGKLQSLAWPPGLLTRFSACLGPPWPEGEIWEGGGSEKRRVCLEVGTGGASEHRKASTRFALQGDTNSSAGQEAKCRKGRLRNRGAAMACGTPPQFCKAAHLHMWSTDTTRRRRTSMPPG